MDNNPTRICEYCKKSPQILQICTHCEKVSYCNESHKARHLSQHQLDCFPAYVNAEEGCGRFWVASRDIQKGEFIYTENALVIGPNTECPPQSPLLALAYPTCLGCCRGTNWKYTCSKCHWPVCSKKCEKVPQHADFECKVFKKNKIFASCRPQYYLYIQFLRALLLKHVKPQMFQRMVELEPHIQEREGHKEENQLTKSFYKFLTEDCNLKYEFDLVDHVVGINRINSYSADILNSNSKKRACTALFCQMSLLNHDCLPNTRSVISENPDLSLTMNLYASIKIWKGQCITQQYVPVVKGTLSRRTALKEWFFDCCCTRCSDPTELGTYFSCLKCSNCDAGFLCPENSLDYSSPYKCDKSGCGSTMSFEDHSAYIKRMEEEIQGNDQTVENLETLLQEMLKKEKIHCHHYLAINIQYDIAQKIVKVLNNERESVLMRRGVKYCKNILDVVDVLCPGSSYYRGVILYFLANLYFVLHEMGELKLKECSIKTLLEIIREGVEIMDVEPKGSVYREMSEELITFQRHLENL